VGHRAERRRCAGSFVNAGKVGVHGRVVD
jgi:hypothetical protein